MIDLFICDRNPDLSIPTFLELALQITQAIAELHDEKVAHLDLKPANIIYNPTTKQLKLSDLNIAQKIPVTASSNFRGTPAYVSPEQTGRMGNSLLDHRSDLYSLGVTFYELLTGNPNIFLYLSLSLLYLHRYLYIYYQYQYLFLCLFLSIPEYPHYHYTSLYLLIHLPILIYELIVI